MNSARLLKYSLILLCALVPASAQAQDSLDGRLLASHNLPTFVPMPGTAKVFQPAPNSMQVTKLQGAAHNGETDISIGNTFIGAFELQTDDRSWCEFKGHDSTTIRVWSNTKANINWKDRSITVDQGDVIVRIPPSCNKPFVVCVPEGKTDVGSGTVRITRSRFGSKVVGTDGTNLI